MVTVTDSSNVTSR